MLHLAMSPHRLFKLALLGSMFFGSVVGVCSPSKAILPVLSVSDPKGGFTDAPPPASYTGDSSFGYYFDLDGSNVIDALGLWAQKTPAWTTGSYTVTLWQYDAVDPANLQPSEISVVSSVTFTAAAANANAYPVKGDYFWQPIPLTTLTGTPADDRKGYIVGVVGNFASTPPGQLTYITAPVGNESFNYDFINEGNGYNFATDATGFYPTPVFPSDGVNGYFNPNLSVVPGPLPVLGAAAGFGWTRRLRKRIRASK